MPKQVQHIEVSIQGNENIEKIQDLMTDWTTEKYRQLLEALNKGKLPAILFKLLEEDTFRETFGKTKQELEHLKINLF
ncbi:hypothetical protein [Geosporobacter ferrireducens]|uniref:Uncharacterized protein n=1 Tax=Geosporobacter ferrireducens TaxID=1424294 RepID=A0A1D8GPM3_9FIRM|nr:hypothetical protein [Geosporobacter ferrireducens]AOT72872.1 hypothetical protein Gferi_26940 [Geosporobacter ferrireducens]MTI55278.1 hypothetical protein [Geosporobacter ferrireducens]